jgi:hypothetical protein
MLHFQGYLLYFEHQSINRSSGENQAESNKEFFAIPTMSVVSGISQRHDGFLKHQRQNAGNGNDIIFSKNNQELHSAFQLFLAKYLAQEMTANVNALIAKYRKESGIYSECLIMNYEKYRGWKTCIPQYIQDLISHLCGTDKVLFRKN